MFALILIFDRKGVPVNLIAGALSWFSERRATFNSAGDPKMFIILGILTILAVVQRVTSD